VKKGDVQRFPSSSLLRSRLRKREKGKEDVEEGGRKKKENSRRGKKKD